MHVPRRYSIAGLLLLATTGLHAASADHFGQLALLFDGARGDGTHVLMRTTLEGAAEPIGAGIAGRRPRVRPGDGAIAYHSHATEFEPARLMLVGDVRRRSAPREIALDRWVQEREIAWSPDGRRIAFHSQHQEAAGDIFVAEVGKDGLLGVLNLTAPSGGVLAIEPDVTPDWSPDGGHIALTSYRGGGAAIWVFAADGRSARQVTAVGTHGDYFPAWSPDGQMIAFQRNEPGRARIGLVASSGGTPMFLDLPGNAYQPAFAPDGEHLAVAITFADGERDLAVVTLDGVVERRLARPGDDQNPHWLRLQAPPPCERDRGCLRHDLGQRRPSSGATPRILSRT